MLQKILLATDGSFFSMKAADMAADIAGKNQAEVEVLVVAPRIPIIAAESNIPASSDPEEELYEMKKIAQQILTDSEKVFAERQIPVHTKILTGDAAENIIREAETEKVDLIMIGTRGQTGIARFILGSVSSKVVNHAPCSVLIVR